VFSYIIQGPDRGMYSLYVAPGGDILKIEDFEDLAKAIFAAERMEESKK
jgi:hypothetical protein